jgi:hypothetical protein
MRKIFLVKNSLQPLILSRCSQISIGLECFLQFNRWRTAMAMGGKNIFLSKLIENFNQSSRPESSSIFLSLFSLWLFTDDVDIRKRATHSKKSYQLLTLG